MTEVPIYAPPTPPFRYTSSKITFIDPLSFPKYRLRHFTSAQALGDFLSNRHMGCYGEQQLVLYGILLALTQAQHDTSTALIADLTIWSTFFTTKLAHNPTLTPLLARVKKTLTKHKKKPVPSILSLFKQEVTHFAEDHLTATNKIGALTANLSMSGAGILLFGPGSHIQQGGIGTSYAFLKHLTEKNTPGQLYFYDPDEVQHAITRHLLKDMKVPFSIITAEDIPRLMFSGQIHLTLLAADTIRANGSAITKNGGHLLNVLSYTQNTPSFICGPLSGCDTTITHPETPINDVQSLTDYQDYISASQTFAFITDLGILMPADLKTIKQT